MKYKEVLPGQFFRLWQVGTSGSQSRFCLKLQTGDAADLATGEVFHIHPTKTIERSTLRQNGRIGLLKDRPVLVSPVSPGRCLCEHFVIIGSEIVAENLIQWAETGAKSAPLPREVDIIISGVIMILRKCLKALHSQAETLETLRDVDIMTGAENFMPTARPKPEFGRGTGEDSFL